VIDDEIFGLSSQYPRPDLHPRRDSDEPRLGDIRFMGYSIRTENYRYTEWVPFENFRPDFAAPAARELYDLRLDGEENENVVEKGKYSGIVHKLSKLLREKNARV